MLEKYISTLKEEGLIAKNALKEAPVIKEVRYITELITDLLSSTLTPLFPFLQIEPPFASPISPYISLNLEIDTVRTYLTIIGIAKTAYDFYRVRNGKGPIINSFFEYIDRKFEKRFGEY